MLGTKTNRMLRETSPISQMCIYQKYVENMDAISLWKPLDHAGLYKEAL